MEPIDHRVTAAKLMALKAEGASAEAIASVLGVAQMGLVDATNTRDEIADFLADGDATTASQLIHAASVRQPHKRCSPTEGR